MLIWLKVLSKLSDNISLTPAGLKSLSTYHINFLRVVRWLAMDMKPYLLRGITRDPSILTSFVKEIWADGHLGSFSQWKNFSSPNDNIWYCDFTNNSNSNQNDIQVDLITGRFLVDGNPIGLLPDNILHHPDFVRVFPCMIFEVLPSSDAPGTFVTKYRFHNAHYSFALNNQNQILIVKERKMNGATFELLSNSPFKELFPYQLVENFSHWLDVLNRKIYFRSLNFEDENFSNNDKIKYRFSIRQQELYKIKPRRKFVCIKSSSYVHTANAIESFESRNYIHLLISGNEVTLELPLMSLHFILDNQNQFISSEYRGMRIAADQKKFGSLIGLKNCLLLESAEPERIYQAEVLLIPNGVPHIELNESKHQVVTVDLNNLSSPRFFKYDVDTRLGRLKAGPSLDAWLYLACLHAMTASPLPDPLTGLTGTESAMQLLQSARCWSCEPFGQRANEIISYILRLSPKRKFYPKGLKVMENVKFSPRLYSLCAHDAFSILAKTLLADSSRLQFLFESDEESVPICSNSDILCAKAYWRSFSFYTPQASIQTEFLPDFDEVKQAKPIHYPGSVLEFNDIPGISVRTMADAGNRWLSYSATSSPLQALQLFLAGPSIESRNGICSVKFPDGNVISWFGLNFPDCWLDLYEFARRVQSSSHHLEWTTLLSFFAFNNLPLDQLLFLQIIAVNPQLFCRLKPPPYRNYSFPSRYEFDPATVEAILNECEKPFQSYFEARQNQKRSGESVEDFEERMRNEYSDAAKAEAVLITQMIQQFWPTNHVSQSHLNIVPELIDLTAALEKINSNLEMRFANLKLHKFLVRVESQIQLASKCESSTQLNLLHFIDGCNKIEESMQVLKIHQLLFIYNPLKSSTTTNYRKMEVKISAAASKQRPIQNREIVRKSNPALITQTTKLPITSFNSRSKIHREFAASLNLSWLQYKNHPSNYSTTFSALPLINIEEWRQFSDSSQAFWKSVLTSFNPKDDEYAKRSLVAAGLSFRVTKETLVAKLSSREKTAQPKELQQLLVKLVMS